MTSHMVSKMSGLNLNRQQLVDVPPAKHEYIIIPTTSAPAWGGYFTIDFKEKHLFCHDLILQFNVSAISGLTGSVANYPNYTPAYFWWTRIELVVAGIVIDNLYPVQQFLLNNLFVTDEDRRNANNGAGAYDSLSQRNALATATSNYYVNLFSLFKQAHIPLLFNHTELQIRVYMDTLANNVNQSTLTGTAVSNINFVNLIAKVSKIQNEQSNLMKKQISNNRHDYKFHELRYGTATIQSGVVSSNIILSQITGPISAIFFVVRPIASVAQNSCYQFTAISSYALLNSASTNISGGQVIPSSLALQVLNKHWTLSSYCAETAIGITDNKANVYMYSFSADPIESIEKGLTLNTYRFTGTEQLNLNFVSSIGAAIQVDFFGLSDAVLCIDGQGIKKMSI